MKTVFVGTAGLAVLAVVGTLAGSAWLTANQRAEAKKPQPWADPSFTTTAVTTGGMLARWMDADGNLDNGHTYVKGIYNLWKPRQTPEVWGSFVAEQAQVIVMPPLWRAEFVADLGNAKAALDAQVERLNAEVSNDLASYRFLGTKSPDSWTPQERRLADKLGNGKK